MDNIENDNKIVVSTPPDETPHLQVILKDGYVYSYATIGSLDGGIDITPFEDMSHFEQHYESYKLVNDELVYDSERDQQLIEERELEELRRRREKECFSVINRGQAWYNSLTSEQSAELQEWYQAWLNVTETKEIPKKPDWI